MRILLQLLKLRKCDLSLIPCLFYVFVKLFLLNLINFLIIMISLFNILFSLNYFNFLLYYNFCLRSIFFNLNYLFFIASLIPIHIVISYLSSTILISFEFWMNILSEKGSGLYFRLINKSPGKNILVCIHNL